MAQEALSKAVKLEPKLIEAWNCLGECYWKNGQVEAARNCFVGALSHVSYCIVLVNKQCFLSDILQIIL